MSVSQPVQMPEPWLHVCIDMQRLFAEKTVWHTPTMGAIIEPIERLVAGALGQNTFTRFVTPPRPEDARGIWRGYYRHYPSVTRARMPEEMLDLIEPLATLVPPARVCDKTGHSAFNSGDFMRLAEDSGAGTLVLSGVETDVCVLATALDAIDHGYGVIIAADAVTSSDENAHDATLTHVYPRFSQQLRVMQTRAIIDEWPGR